MLRIAVVTLLMVVVSSTGFAQALNEQQAKRALFGTRGFDVQMRPNTGLSDEQLGFLEAVLTNQDVRAGQKYYGAAAVAPLFFEMLQADMNAAVMSGLLQVTENFHDPDTAASGAMSACEAARSGRGSPCVLAALTLPRRYKTQPLTLSVTATEAFKVYDRTSAPKVFVISNRTGRYSIGQGASAEATAIAQCNSGTNGVNDCRVVVRD